MPNPTAHVALEHTVALPPRENLPAGHAEQPSVEELAPSFVAIEPAGQTMGKVAVLLPPRQNTPTELRVERAEEE